MCIGWKHHLGGALIQVGIGRQGGTDTGFDWIIDRIERELVLEECCNRACIRLGHIVVVVEVTHGKAPHGDTILESTCSSSTGSSGSKDQEAGSSVSFEIDGGGDGGKCSKDLEDVDQLNFQRRQQHQPFTPAHITPITRR